MIAVVALIIAAGALAEEQWLAPGADAVGALTTSPGECYAAPSGTNDAYLAEIGRAAFMSPLLFGGQAARAGLSCASCHSDGQANADFFLEGLSDRPGTADVTTSIFSTVREDGVFNPQPIPSLVGVAGNSTFGTIKSENSLHAFIGGALTEEFNAAPPPAAILDGLVAYVSALDEGSCPEGPVALTPRRAIGDVLRTLDAAGEAAARNDKNSADFLLATAQALLGRINDRYPAADAAPLRARLGELSIEVAVLRNGDSLTRDQILRVRREVRKLGGALHKARAASLYDPLTLAADLARRDRK